VEDPKLCLYAYWLHNLVKSAPRVLYFYVPPSYPGLLAICDLFVSLHLMKIQKERERERERDCVVRQCMHNLNRK
jgi:hypothetical protein